jgi:hypothetical protein
MRNITYLFSFIPLFTNFSSIAQLNGDLREEVVNRLTEKEIKMLDIGDRFYKESEFLLALPYYDSLVTKFPDNLYLSYMLGSCSVFDDRNLSSGNVDIYKSKQMGSSWIKPEKMKGINSNIWEGSVCLSPDQKTIYFSSERPGGLAGRNVYFATLQADGSWGNVKNLVPEINTKYDEDAPFVHADGKTLFFASKEHTTIGGYYIFKS